MPAPNDAAGLSQANPIQSVEELEDRLTTPTPQLIESMRDLEGDLLVLGAGGKMGPTLVGLAARAVAASNVPRRVLAVSDSISADRRARFDAAGIEAIEADLLDTGALERLPNASNVIYMVGRKFGSTGAEHATWNSNVFLPGLVARRYCDSRIVAFSSGNIYPFMPVDSNGATEATQPSPVGEYAMSCLGRERMFDYAAHELGARVTQFRLNYAAELRYGVLVDIAQQVWNGQPVDVTMGYANFVWQGYANAVAIQSLRLAESPPFIINVTGPEKVSIRKLAERLGELMGKRAHIVGEEAPTALLSNASMCHELFGLPQVRVDRLAEWVAHWIVSGRETLGKPTHFEVRDGKF